METSKWIALSGSLLVGLAAVGCGASESGDYGMSSGDSAASEAPGGEDDGDGMDELPEAGQLTAGEWSDLTRWDYWLELHETNTAEFADAEAKWELRTRDRVVVRVMHDGEPVSDAKVRLVDDSTNEIWDTRTDMDGRANLFHGALPERGVGTTIRVNRNKETVVMPLPVEHDSSEPVVVQMDEDHAVPDTVDVAFVLDTTGSMGDELSYIQSELVNVIEQAETRTEGVEFRVGSAVYRDKGDRYVSRGRDFTSPESVENFLTNQSANGGGDYPEAVEAGLEEALNFDWSENARTRILFLVLDAPPHEQRIDQVRRMTSRAAERGVRIIPVSASGIDQPTEQLLRSMAVLTGGTYTFLTDDSGIGNDHLEPTVGEFKVEMLNELLLRLIVERSGH